MAGQQSAPYTWAVYGFTTIELLLVGVLAAIVVPHIHRTRYQVTSGVQSVGTALLVAQRAAITGEHDVAVSFDVPNRRLES